MPKTHAAGWLAKPIVLLAVKTPGINVVGMTMLLQFVVGFGFILAVNAPHNMIAYGTGTFEARDFVRTGLVTTLAATALRVDLTGSERAGRIQDGLVSTGTSMGSGITLGDPRSARGNMPSSVLMRWVRTSMRCSPSISSTTVKMSRS